MYETAGVAKMVYAAYQLFNTVSGRHFNDDVHGMAIEIATITTSNNSLAFLLSV